MDEMVKRTEDKMSSQVWTRLMQNLCRRGPGMRLLYMENAHEGQEMDQLEGIQSQNRQLSAIIIYLSGPTI